MWFRSFPSVALALPNSALLRREKTAPRSHCWPLSLHILDSERSLTEHCDPGDQTENITKSESRRPQAGASLRRFQLCVRKPTQLKSCSQLPVQPLPTSRQRDSTFWLPESVRTREVQEGFIPVLPKPRYRKTNVLCFPEVKFLEMLTSFPWMRCTFVIRR